VLERLLAATMLAWVALAPALAGAQSSSVSEGAALYAEADFEGAVARLEQALANETLSAADVELALDRIAASQLAQGSRGLDRTLARLAVVARDHRFGADVPQALVARFERVAPEARPIEIDLQAIPLPSGRVRVSALAGEDPLEMVRSVELRCGEQTDVGVAPTLEVEASARCEAIVRGPGATTLARAVREPESSSGGGSPGGTTGGSAQSLEPLWIGLGVGGAVLVLGAVIAGVAIAASSGGSSDVTVTGPFIRFGP